MFLNKRADDVRDPDPPSTPWALLGPSAPLPLPAGPTVAGAEDPRRGCSLPYPLSSLLVPPAPCAPCVQGFDSDDDDEDEAPRAKKVKTGGAGAGAGADAGGAGEGDAGAGGAGKGTKEAAAPMIMLPEWIAKAEKKGYTREEYVSKFWKVGLSM